MKKLLILGAGVYQVPLIITAKKMGIYTIVVSYRGDYPGFSIADKVYYTDTTDTDEVLTIAQKEKIDGITTAGSDVAMLSVGKVVSSMNLFGPSWESVQLVTNKQKMKEAFMKHGVRTAKWQICTNIKEARLIYEQLSSLDQESRVVFKAVDSSGSRGIVIVSKTDEIESAYQQVMEITKESYFIIEQFLFGIEFGAQALIHNNEIIYFIPHGDILYKTDSATVPIGHYLPCDISEEVTQDAKNQLLNTIRATGINNCAVNVDYILCNNKVYMLEIGARAGATCLPELIECYSGISYYKAIIKLAFGTKPHIVESAKQPCAAKLLYSNQTGTVKSIELNLIESEELYELKLDIESNDKVRKFSVGPDRIGHIVVKGQTADDAKSTMEKLINKIEIKIKE